MTAALLSLPAMTPRRLCSVTHCADPAHLRITYTAMVRHCGTREDVYIDGALWSSREVWAS